MAASPPAATGPPSQDGRDAVACLQRCDVTFGDKGPGGAGALLGASLSCHGKAIACGRLAGVVAGHPAGGA